MSGPLHVLSPIGLDAPLEQLVLAPPLDGLAGKQLVLLGNRKQNMDLLLMRVGERLRADGAEIAQRRKASAATGAGVLIRELSARARGVVTGMGD